MDGQLSRWTANFGVVPLFCSRRLRVLPFRAWRIFRAVLVFIILEGIAIPFVSFVPLPSGAAHSLAASPRARWPTLGLHLGLCLCQINNDLNDLHASQAK